MNELAADGVPVAVTCRVLKLSRQPYYRWLADPVRPAELLEAVRANALFDAHRDDPEFGHRLLADEARDAGQVMADRTAWRIASDNGWFSTIVKRRGKNGKKPGPAVHDDLCAVTDDKGRIRHEFTAEAMNRLGSAAGIADSSQSRGRGGWPGHDCHEFDPFASAGLFVSWRRCTYVRYSCPEGRRRSSGRVPDRGGWPPAPPLSRGGGRVTPGWSRYSRSTYRGFR